MKIGLIARGEDRGLGVLTREFARHMAPERTLLIRPDSARDHGLVSHAEWFDPDALHSGWSGDLEEHLCRRFLEGLDVVYTAETAYDWRLCDWAREMDVRTVCHTMPEYMKHVANPYNRFPPDLPAPDVWWNPTCWRQEHLPAGTEIVPVPVALDRFPAPEARDGPVRWLHVVGSRAPSDRNGTRVFLEALKLLKAEQHVIVRSQSEPFYPTGGSGRNVHVEVHCVDLAEYWQLYGGADALVLPRRYGGLSLIAQEAMAAGLALVMPDVEPQSLEWPIMPIAAPFENAITTSAGSIPICAPDPKDLAFTMDWLAKHRGPVRASQQASRVCAEGLSWERQKPAIVAALERACG